LVFLKTGLAPKETTQLQTLFTNLNAWHEENQTR